MIIKILIGLRLIIRAKYNLTFGEKVRREALLSFLPIDDGAGNHFRRIRWYGKYLFAAVHAHERPFADKTAVRRLQ